MAYARAIIKSGNANDRVSQFEHRAAPSPFSDISLPSCRTLFPQKTSRSTHSKMKQIYSSYSFVSVSGFLKLLFMHIILTSCLFGVSLERAIDGFLWEAPSACLPAPPYLRGGRQISSSPSKPQNKISRLNFIMANWRWSLFRSAVQIKSQTALGPRGVWVTTPFSSLEILRHAFWRRQDPQHTGSIAQFKQNVAQIYHFLW